MMKTLTRNIFLELLSDCIEEEMKAGNIQLTQKVNENSIMLAGSINSAVKYVFGVSQEEEFGVISLN